MKLVYNLTTLYWSLFTKPETWAVFYVCKEYVSPILFIGIVMWFICMKDILIGALPAGKHHTGRGGKTGVLQVLILIRIVEASLTAINQFRKSIYVLFSTFRPLSDKIIECIHSNFRDMFSIYGLNLTIFWSFGYISHKDRLLKIFSSPVKMWPAGLYMNAELTQVQSIEFVNVEILQHVFVVGDLGCSVRDDRNRLIF